jgi:hypothetical protein
MKPTLYEWYNQQMINKSKPMTAVEWYTEQLRKIAFDTNHHLGLGDIRLTQGQINELNEQAKEMEKEQMHKCASFWRGKENEIEKPMFDLYYNETYNK